MNILFTRFPLESANGGAENQTTWLWEGLKKRGHDVSFLGSCTVLLKRAEVSGIKYQVLRIGAPPVTKFGALSYFWRKNAMQKKLLDVAKKIEPKPDVICMLSLSEKLLLTEWAHALGIKVVWIEHDRIGRWLRWNPWLPMLRKLSYLAVTVCVSELGRSKYLELGWEERKTIAIANGVPFAEKLQVPSSDIQGAPLRVGCLSRLSPEKGVDVLVSAVIDMPEVSLTIVGTGPEDAYLRTLIAPENEKHGTERIMIRPKIETIDELFGEIDVFVLPSVDHDPFGLAAAEAMMRGIPVIVTDETGIAGSLTNEHDAIIIPADSIPALQEAISTMSDVQMRTRLGTAALETAHQKFSLERMIDEYVTILS